ncbi:MAG: hypothetical protein K0V04_41350 [Deltaproteobacteria bacterium]|nr:hypothetical protein [Deltaproteobacteria bacterium]
MRRAIVRIEPVMIAVVMALAGAAAVPGCVAAEDEEAVEALEESESGESGADSDEAGFRVFHDTCGGGEGGGPPPNQPPGCSGSPWCGQFTSLDDCTSDCEDDACWHADGEWQCDWDWYDGCIADCGLCTCPG